MSTIAIVGAGPGLGASIARRFGREGFDIALISRNQAKLDALAAQLGDDGVRVAGFAADVTDRPGLGRALAEAERRLGAIEVLEYSPAPTPDVAELAPVGALDVTVESVAPQLEYYLYGGIAAVRQVLPGMLARGRGTILVTTGASSGPLVHPPFANIAAAGGALRNYVLHLHAALESTGVYAAHVPIAAWIGKGGPQSQPDAIAETYWQLHVERTEAERFYRDEDLSP